MKHNASIWLAMVVVIAIVASGCLSNVNLPPAQTPPYIHPTASHLNDTDSTPEGVSSVVEANNKFAFDLYSRYKEEYKDDNVFYSPFSISTALAMTYEGAKGQTAEEMRQVFYFPEDPSVRRPDFAKVLNGINNHSGEYQLRTANALWAQEDYRFLEEYFRIIEEYYGGNVTEKSRITINTWVENQTNGKIKDLIPQGAIDGLTRLVLTNAIYFKGNWSLQFNKSNTYEEDFKAPNKTVSAETMHITDNFNYTETDEVQVLEMTYSGQNISMLIILPKGDDLDITIEKLNKWRSKLEEREVVVSLPRFKLETKYFMNDDLIEMGMPTAFSDSADFSDMTGGRDLFIGSVIHQAFVEVNEEGTEAAAATGVVMPTSAMPTTFKADHPFVFIIQDRNTGNILFIGRVADPSA